MQAETANRRLDASNRGGAASEDAGSNGADIRFAACPVSLGQALVAWTTRGICAILIGDDEAALAADLVRRFPGARTAGGDDDCAARLAPVARFLESPQGGLALPLDLRGTAFQKRVWQALIEIPPGQTSTYGQVAKAIGLPRAARAVAAACAANPLAVAIPCHRVLASDGKAAGYRWGVGRKLELLRREAAV